MDKKHIQILLSNFFEKDFPKEKQDRFRAWFIREENIQEKDEVLQDIWNSLPESVALSSLDELTKVNKRIHTRKTPFYRRIAAIVAIFLLPLLGAVSMYLFMHSNPTVESIQLVECFVPNGERKQIVLPDGSAVWLNAGSLLIYPKEFNGESRTMFLSGEGNFTVATDENKPFVVKTNHIEVEALGTVFNLQSYPDADKTTTILEIGKVRVNDRAGLLTSVILQPNEQLIYDHTNNTFDKRNVEAARFKSWTDGFLVFRQESLKNIFRSLERRYNVNINYNDTKFANTSFTVRFHADETLEEALEILARIGINFKYKIINNDVYIK